MCNHVVLCVVVLLFTGTLNFVPSAILVAAQHGHSRVVATLLHYRADINARNRSGLTAYQLACGRGDGESSQAECICFACNCLTASASVWLLT